MGTAQNDRKDVFWQADLEIAAAELVKIILEIKPQVLITYDEIGGYGHPDHIQIHRVGHRAAELVQESGKSLRVLESTMNRTRIVKMMKQVGGGDFDPDGPADDGNPFGTLEEEITMAVDVSTFVETKRKSIMCHASQVTDSSMFLHMTPEMFTMAFGEEFFIERGQPGGAQRGWFL
jgi:LmbE family N-acetylglucosaminyl deacetylase